MVQTVEEYTSGDLARVDMVLFSVYERSNSKHCLELSLSGPDKNKIGVFSVEAIVRKVIEEHTPTLETKSILDRINDVVEKEGKQLCYRVNGNLVVDVSELPAEIKNNPKYANAINNVAGNPDSSLNNKRFFTQGRTSDGQPMLSSKIHLGNLLDFVQGAGYANDKARKPYGS